MKENTMEKKGKKPSKIKSFLKSRKAKHGTVAILLTVLFIVAAVLLNVVASVLTDKFPALSADLTKSAVYEIRQTTAEYLKDLKKDVTIYVMMDEQTFESYDEYYVQANKLLRNMEQSSDKVTLRYIDLGAKPTFTTPYKQVDWTQSHVLLIESGDNYRAIDSVDLFDYNEEYAYYYNQYIIEGQHVEQAVVTAILNVTTDEKIGVSVLTGQGEEDCSQFVKLLENNAYEVEEVSLLSGKISDNSQFVVIFDPSTDIDDDVFNTLTEWLYNDGRYGHTLVYLPNDQKDVKEFENLNALLDEWGMQVEYGYIYETDATFMTNSMDPNLISIFNYNDTDYSQDLRDPSIPVVLFYGMPVTITDTTKANALLTSSDSAVFLPKDADENWTADGADKGTLNGAVISTEGGDDSKSHVIVIGSYDAWSKSALSANSFNNAQYFINLFNKIASRDEVGITIEGKNLDNAELGTTSTEAATVWGILVRYLIPAAVLIAGIVVWLRRRHL